MNKTKYFLLTLFLVFQISCAEDFDSFYEVKDLRILAIKVDPPDLVPGATAQISALIHSSDDDTFTYNWSWCPLTTGSVNGYECLINEEDYSRIRLLLLASGNGSLPPLNLGTKPEIGFFYNLNDNQLQEICEMALSEIAFPFAVFPDCSEKLNVILKLEVKTENTTVVAKKNIVLLFGNNNFANTNPEIKDILVNGLSKDEELVFSYGSKIEINIVAEESISEEFKDSEGKIKNESLFVTWFITQGEMENDRTSYIPLKTDFEALLKNQLTLPSKKNSIADNAQVFIVLQDQRGGVAWETININIQEH